MNANSYWYLGISGFCVLALAFTFFKKRSIQAVLLFLIAVELAYLIEAVIYTFLGSYEYHPNLIKNNPYYDSHLGALSSNLLTVPTLALLLAVFDLSWLWIIAFTLTLAAVEWLFVKLGIYTLYWWKISYTSLGLLVYFPVVKYMYRRLGSPLKDTMHVLFLFLCIGPISGTIQFLPFMFFDCRRYQVGWFKNIYYDTSAFGVVYYITLSILMTLLAKRQWKYNWMKYLLLEVFLVSLNWILMKKGVLVSRVQWDLWFYTLFPLVILGIADRMSLNLRFGPKHLRGTERA